MTVEEAKREARALGCQVLGVMRPEEGDRRPVLYVKVPGRGVVLVRLRQDEDRQAAN